MTEQNPVLSVRHACQNRILARHSRRWPEKSGNKHQRAPACVKKTACRQKATPLPGNTTCLPPGWQCRGRSHRHANRKLPWDISDENGLHFAGGGCLNNIFMYAAPGSGPQPNGLAVENNPHVMHFFAAQIFFHKTCGFRIG